MKHQRKNKREADLLGVCSSIYPSFSFTAITQSALSGMTKVTSIYEVIKYSKPGRPQDCQSSSHPYYCSDVEVEAPEYWAASNVTMTSFQNLQAASIPPMFPRMSMPCFTPNREPRNWNHFSSMRSFAIDEMNASENSVIRPSGNDFITGGSLNTTSRAEYSLNEHPAFEYLKRFPSWCYLCKSQKFYYPQCHSYYFTNDDKVNSTFCKSNHVKEVQGKNESKLTLNQRSRCMS
jgi:hypothetical protein